MSGTAARMAPIVSIQAEREKRNLDAEGFEAKRLVGEALLHYVEASTEVAEEMQQLLSELNPDNPVIKLIGCHLRAAKRSDNSLEERQVSVYLALKQGINQIFNAAVDIANPRDGSIYMADIAVALMTLFEDRLKK